MAAKGQTLADLKIKLTTLGLKDVDILRKELKSISQESKVSEKSFKGLAAEIKKFGKETLNTTVGIKGQIAAFEKLRDRAAFQGTAYRNLTREIVNMNKALVRRLDIEKELGTGGRTGRKSAGSDVTSGLLASNYFTNSTRRREGTQAEFSDRISKLQMLMYARTFESLSKQQQEFLDGIGYTKGGWVDQSKLRNTGLANQMIDDKARATNPKTLGQSIFNIEDFKKRGQLNELQLKALNIKGALDVKSDEYLQVLTKINAEEGHQSTILSQQELRSRADIANKKARTIATNKLADAQIRFAQSEAYGLHKGAMRGGTQVPMMSKDFAKAPEQFTKRLGATRKFLGQNMLQRQIQQVLSVMNLKSPLYKEVEAEAAYNDPTYFAKYIGSKGGTSDIYKPPGMRRFLGQKGTQQGVDSIINKLGKVEREDSFGLGGDVGYPMTSSGQMARMQDLQKTLKDLVPGTENWKTVKQELIKVDKEWVEMTQKANDSLKVTQKTMKALPAAGQTGKKGGALAAYDPKFAAQQSTGLKHTVESLDQYLDRVRKGTKVQNLNINSLTKQRAKLDELRNGLDPTSAAFRNATKAIANTDKALSRLNNNKFSGANLGRTAQSILGASFFGGPAGFLGSTLGAGVEALRPGGNMSQGAITGGLVASQVLQPVAGFLSGSSTYASDIAKLEIALEKATGKGEDFKIALDTAALVTKKFNVPQEIATRGMTRLAAAVTGAGGTVEHAAIAFHNVTAAIKGTAGSSEDVKSAITAMVQIFSKGRVSAEELSGQLGERFPGAVTKFQEANSDIYKSTADLQDALKKGEVGLKQLWEFVMLLGDEYTDTAAKIGASDEEAGARAVVQMNALRIHLGQLLKPIGAQFQVIQAQILEDIIPAIVKMGEWAVKVGQIAVTVIKFVQKNFDDLRDTILIFGGGLLLGTLMQSIATVIAGGITLTKVINGIRNAMVALNIASFANPWVALAAGIIAAAVAVDRFLNGTKKLQEKAASGDFGAIAQAKKMVEDLKKTNEKLANQFDENFKNNLKTTPRPGSEMYEEALETYKKKIEANKDLIKELLKAIEDGNAANNQAQKDLIENLKKGLEPLPGFGGGEGGDGDGVYKGFSGGIKKFSDDVKNMTEEVANVTASWFDRMADSLTNFVMTGKLKFKEFARSIIADIAKMIAKQMIFNMIAGLGNWGSLAADRRFSGLGKGSALNSPIGDLPKGANGLVVAKNGIVPYAKGGIVNSPTLFPFAKGVGLMGEAGPEAIVPLKRGRDGKLGIAGGGGATTVNVSVDAKGTKVEGDGKQMAQLGRMLGSAIEMELAKQKRPGGLLA